jgi:hypothetical protein
MSAIPEPKPDDRIAALEKKIADLEQNWTWLKWAAGILATAVLLLTGYGFIDIPRRAGELAVEKVTPIALKAAEDEAGKRIPDTIVRGIQGHQQRAKEAADEAAKSRKRVKDLEGQMSGSPLAKLEKVKEQAELGTAKAFGFYNRHDLQIKQNIAKVVEVGKNQYRVYFVRSPGQHYVVLVLNGGRSHASVVTENKKRFLISGVQRDRGIFFVVFAKPPK